MVCVVIKKNFIYLQINIFITKYNSNENIFFYFDLCLLSFYRI